MHVANAFIFVYFFSTSGKLAYIWHFRWTEINATQFEKRRNDFKSDDFAAVCVVNAKVHSWRKYEPRSQGFFPEKMRGMGKGPGVSRSILVSFCRQSHFLREKDLGTRLRKYFWKFSLSSKYIFLFDFSQRGRVFNYSLKAGFTSDAVRA